MHDQSINVIGERNSSENRHNREQIAEIYILPPFIWYVNSRCSEDIEAVRSGSLEVVQS